MKQNKITLINFRDMGGLDTPHGKIKSGKLYRTAIIRPKSVADKQYLSSIALDTVIDLRTPMEVQEKPDKLLDGIEYVNISVFGEDTSNILAPTRKTLSAMLHASEQELASVKTMIAQSYRDMIFNSAAYGEIFNRMDSGKTIAFHCTAGKDRTGIGAILIELALGRTPQQCLGQYLLSNQHREQDNRRMMRKLKLLHVKPHVKDFSLYVSMTHNELFDTAMDAISQQYSTIDEFLQQQHGITADRRAQWINFYIEKRTRS